MPNELLYSILSAALMLTLGSLIFAFFQYRRQNQLWTENELTRAKNSDLERSVDSMLLQRKNESDLLEKRLGDLKHLTESFAADRNEFKESQQRQLALANERRRTHWLRHEQNAIETLSASARRFDLVLFDKNNFPLQKRPDFAVQIGAEYLIFDAKAPEDPEKLSYFPEYLRRQAETMEKYLKQEGVRKEAFLVVPADTLPELQGRLFIETNGYQIFIIPPEAVFAILKLYHKLQLIESMTSTNPEDQERTASFMAQGLRFIKRKIQLDQSWSKSSLDYLAQQNQLPDDLLAQISDKEKSFSLNPQRLDRGKEISLLDLEKDHKKIESQAAP